MAIQVQEIKKPWYLGGRTSYRVISTKKAPRSAGSYLINDLFQIVENPNSSHKGLAKNVDHLRPDIRQWLENSIPYHQYTIDTLNDWDVYFVSVKNEPRDRGIVFKDASHAMMFKLAWG